MKSVLTFVVAMLAACTLERPADVPDEGDIDPTIVIAAESGDAQAGVAGEPLAMPFVVRVTNGNGPIENFTVDFAVKSGGGRLSETSVRTDVLGHARTTLTLGDVVGPNVVEATGSGTASVATFTTNGDPGPVASLELVPASASATVGTEVGLTVTALDQRNNAVPDVAVTLTATEGVLIATSVTTGDSGEATSAVQLTNLVGTTRVEATVTGVAQPAVADIVRVAAMPASLALVSGNNQIALPGTMLPQPLVVRVKDTHGNLVSGATVDFTVTAGGATLSQTMPSDAQGLARTSVTLAMSFSQVMVQASIAGVTPVTFTGRARSFASKVDVPANSGYQVIGLESGDLNNDGKLDLVMCSSYLSASILFNTTANNATTPTFATPFELDTSYYCNTLAVGDVTGDGKPDLVLAHSSSSLEIYPNATPDNAATPTFGAVIQISPYSWNDLELVDLDSDGKLDIVGTSNSYSVVRWVRNTTTDPATPTFSEHQVTTNQSNMMAVGDINGDGKPDFVVGSRNTAKVSVLLNTTTDIENEGFTVSPIVELIVAAVPNSIALRDLNGDNKPEIIAANPSTNSISILRNMTTTNATTPTFAAKVDYTVGTNPHALHVADLNKDGKLDVIVANRSANTASVLLNTSTSAAAAPTLGAKYDLPTGLNPNGVVAVDLNGDTFLDIATSNGGTTTASIMLSR